MACARIPSSLLAVMKTIGISLPDAFSAAVRAQSFPAWQCPRPDISFGQCYRTRETLPQMNTRGLKGRNSGASRATTRGRIRRRQQRPQPVYEPLLPTHEFARVESTDQYYSLDRQPHETRMGHSRGFV